MNSLFLVIVALTQIGRTMGIVDNLDKKEVVLGIMSNICPLLGEFNTPLGAEGEILSVRWQKSGQKILIIEKLPPVERMRVDNWG